MYSFGDLCSYLWMEEQPSALTWMMMAMLGVACCVLVAVRLGCRRGKKSPSLRLPPLIPGAVPFLGHLFSVDRTSPHLSMARLAAEHGPVFRLRILNADIVVLSDRESIREAMFKEGAVFAGRPSIFRIQYGFHGCKDIIFATYSSRWVALKKLASQAFRRFAVGHQAVEASVQEEMVDLVRAVQEQGGEDFDPGMITLTAVVNALSAAIIGRRYKADDSRMLQYKLTTRLFSRACSVVEGMELDLFPVLRFLPNESFRKLKEARHLLDCWVDQELGDVKERYNPTKPSCILDVLLDEVDRTKDASADWKMTHDDVRSIFVDLLVSGTLTTAIALNAFLLMVVHHPREQRQLQLEIHTHVGENRLPTGSDRSAMPRMEAAIFEVLRLISHVPLCLPHFTTDDTVLKSYFIPKNTQVLFNLWALHHDESIWDEPWVFKPDRFLAADGQLLPPSHPTRKSLLPFGGGHRMCIGEALARERLFLFATAILQKFTLLPPEGEQLASCDPRDFDLGLILEPKPFRIRAESNCSA